MVVIGLGVALIASDNWVKRRGFLFITLGVILFGIQYVPTRVEQLKEKALAQEHIASK